MLWRYWGRFFSYSILIQLIKYCIWSPLQTDRQSFPMTPRQWVGWDSKPVNLELNLNFEPRLRRRKRASTGGMDTASAVQLMTESCNSWWIIIIIIKYYLKAICQEYSWIQLDLFKWFIQFQVKLNLLSRQKRRLLGQNIQISFLAKAEFQPSVPWWRLLSKENQEILIGRCCCKISETKCQNAQNWDFTDRFRILKVEKFLLHWKYI